MQGKNLMVGIVVVALIAIVMGAVVMFKNNSDQAITVTDNDKPSGAMMQAPPRGMMATGAYKNGTYTADGEYITPGGQEKVGVTLTLTDGVISEINVEEKGILATSKKMQADFGANYKPMVMGKNINEVTLTKVSGSSLTPKGFNDALTKIKAQAAS